ncbi:hypothetical protein AK812_SmicGene29723 [Symbiodinium microadriaticum]|uniref:Uncharacterized protein n=1 Tax=Symbiodinium microadriaticum TaxID=2951 RepID=A0A1Q9D127_SYMMI|nr:hypothetical protein AK812_SmicGene29723 [Symbiodinium microadriaticum]
MILDDFRDFPVWMQTRSPDAPRVYHNPFSLGGERQKAVRSEDNDCRAAEADPLFPSTWVMPAYGSHTTSRVLRRSCGLFDEWQDAPCYGHDLLVVVRDLALDKKDADYAVWANPVPADIKDTMKQSRTMEEMRNKSLAPHPGLGPPQEARALGFMESYVVAEAESGDWSHVHFLGGDGFEVTAITCTCAALAILEDFEAYRFDCVIGYLLHGFLGQLVQLPRHQIEHGDISLQPRATPLQTDRPLPPMLSLGRSHRLGLLDRLDRLERRGFTWTQEEVDNCLTMEQFLDYLEARGINQSDAPSSTPGTASKSSGAPPQQDSHPPEAEEDRSTSTRRDQGSSHPRTTTTGNDETLETPSATTKARGAPPPKASSEMPSSTGPSSSTPPTTTAAGRPVDLDGQEDSPEGHTSAPTVTSEPAEGRGRGATNTGASLPLTNASRHFEDNSIAQEEQVAIAPPTQPPDATEGACDSQESQQQSTTVPPTSRTGVIRGLTPLEAGAARAIPRTVTAETSAFEEHHPQPKQHVRIATECSNYVYSQTDVQETDASHAYHEDTELPGKARQRHLLPAAGGPTPTSTPWTAQLVPPDAGIGEQTEADFFHQEEQVDWGRDSHDETEGSQEESLSPDARGVLTPAAAFHGSSLQQRLEAHAFAAGAGQKMSFEVLKGKPAEEKIVTALTTAAKRRQKAVQLLETGSLQAWDVPSMIK